MMKFNSIFWKVIAIVLVVYLAWFLWSFSKTSRKLEAALVSGLTTHIHFDPQGIIKVNKVTGRVDVFTGGKWVHLGRPVE